MDELTFNILLMSTCLLFSGIICILLGFKAVITKRIHNGGAKGSWRGKAAIFQGKLLLAGGIVQIILSLILYLLTT